MNDIEALKQIRAGVDALISNRELVIEPPPAEEPPPAPEPEVPAGLLVATPAELWAALKAAKGGDVLRLAAGAWKGVKLLDFKFDQSVTIEGESGAKLFDLQVKGCAGLILRDLEMEAVHAGGSNPFNVQDSQRIGLMDLFVHGSLDDDASNDTSAMQIRNCQDVTVAGCTFEELANAVTHLDCVRISFFENAFRRIRMDGIRGGGSDDLRIERNYFTDFRPILADHGDAIQVWTSNTTKSAKGILIRDNVVVQGAGGQVQGIFVTMQTSHRYKGVEITDNLIIGGLTNAIMVTGADGVVIARNDVVAVKEKTWIRMENLTGVDLTGNASNSYYKAGVVEMAAEADNAKLPTVSDAGKAALQEWAVTRRDLSMPGALVQQAWASA